MSLRVAISALNVATFAFLSISPPQSISLSGALSLLHTRTHAHTRERTRARTVRYYMLCAYILTSFDFKHLLP